VALERITKKAFPLPWEERKLKKETLQMAMEQSEIEAMILTALPDAIIEIQDLAGDGDHYAAKIISSAFEGKNRVQQHQMVYAALKGKMGGELHALALTTATPE